MLVPKPLARSLWRAAKAVLRPTTPILAQLVVTRRCNLACGYCSEYDHHSLPVDVAELRARIDALAEAGTVVLTLTGGEPLLHPRLHELIRFAVSRGMVCTSVTNGYPLTRESIERLNAAGLTLLQISIDNLEPNAVSQKSWRRLKPRLALLRDHARFAVTVNAVLGSCTPGETREVAKGVRELGFYMTVGLMHDERGQVSSGLVSEPLLSTFNELRSWSRKSLFHLVGEGWERRLIREGVSPWKCRAGSRYLYIDENGTVSYCSQRRDEPGVELRAYSRSDRRRAFYARKGCEARCTIACVRRASALDALRWQRPLDHAVISRKIVQS